MPWLLIDDKFHSHPKVDKAGNEAVGLFARSGSWSRDYGTNGVVPVDTAHRFGKPALWQRLIDAGLVEPRTDKKAPYILHDFADYNPLATCTERATDRPPAQEQASVQPKPTSASRADRMRELGRRGGLARAAKLAGDASGASADASDNLAHASQNPSVAASVALGNPSADASENCSGTLAPSPHPSPIPDPVPNPENNRQNQSAREGSGPSEAASGNRSVDASAVATNPSVASSVAASEGPSAASGKQTQSVARSSVAPLARWHSPDEQDAGERILSALRDSARDGAAPGPLAALAEVRLVRELLTHTSEAGSVGRLAVADVVAAVEYVADQERTRLLVSTEVAKAPGDLARWLRSTVKGWRRDGATKAPQRASAGRPVQTPLRGLQPNTSKEQELAFLNKPVRPVSEIPGLD